jgi:hypothetical protein
MAFLNPAEEDANSSPLRRSDPNYAKIVELFGYEWNDWGGGVSDGIIAMSSGCFLALLIISFPYPVTCLAQATHHVEFIAALLRQHWQNTIDFYTASEKDEMNKANMLSSMGIVKDEIGRLEDLLEGTFWEVVFFPWVSSRACPHWPNVCVDSRMARYDNFTKLRETLSKCIVRLCHVVDACEREKFEESHGAMMLSCKDAVDSLASSTFKLLETGVQTAQDGILTEDEKDKLRCQVQDVERFEDVLSKEVKWHTDYLIRRESHDAAAAQEVRGQLATEQVFMFSLCHFADSIRTYCKGLADGQKTDALEERLHSVCDAGRIFCSSFNRAIFGTKNLKFVARVSIAIFLGFFISWVGYGHVIVAKDATIPSKIAALLSDSNVSPVTNMFDRLTGIVLGKFLGKLTYALLGWCYPGAQVCLAIVVFMYVWLTLTVYLYTSRFSSIGMLAAAFGTEAFLQGCNNETQTQVSAHMLVYFVIAICIMTLMERVVSMGRPSELAYEDFVQAWRYCHDSLRDLFAGDKEDNGLDVAHFDLIESCIARAETFAREADHEQRCWRGPFPVALFSHLTSFARWMRVQLVCIRTVAYGEHRRRSSKTEWFKHILEDEVWKNQVDGLLEELGETLDMLIEIQENNRDRSTSLSGPRSARTSWYSPLGGPQNVAPRRISTADDIQQHVIARSPSHRSAKSNRKRQTAADIEHHLITVTHRNRLPRREDEDEDEDIHEGNLVEDEDVQRAFIAGCLESLRQRNLTVQVEIVKNSQVERGAVDEGDSDDEGGAAERIRAPPRTQRRAPQMHSMPRSFLVHLGREVGRAELERLIQEMDPQGFVRQVS